MCTPMMKNNWERGELKIGSVTFGELIKKAHFFSHTVLPAPLSHSLRRAATLDSVIKTLSEACCSLTLSRQSGDTHSPALEPRCSGRRARLLSPCQVWDYQMRLSLPSILSSLSILFLSLSSFRCQMSVTFFLSLISLISLTQTLSPSLYPSVCFQCSVFLFCCALRHDDYYYYNRQNRGCTFFHMAVQEVAH